MKLLFDTYAIITLLHQEKGWESVQKLMEDVDSGNSDGYLSTVTLVEIKYLFQKLFGREIAERRIIILLYSPLSIIPVTQSIALCAGGLKMKGISIADSMIGATAIELNAKVVSADSHFELMGISTINYP